MVNEVLFYILLAKYLYGGMDKLVKSEMGYAIDLPFGHGPWQCKNKVCPHYNLFSIRRCERSIKQYILGTFTCTECGFSYSRKLIFGSDELKDHIFVKDFGFLWHQIVSRMLAEGKSMIAIAREIGSDAGTIRKYYKNINQLNSSAKRKKMDVNDRKEKVILTISQFPKGQAGGILKSCVVIRYTTS
jgi:hypothetical protein